MSSTTFRWGEVLSKTFYEDIEKVFEEQALWRKNTFSPPSSHAGTEFVKERTRLLRAYKDSRPVRSFKTGGDSLPSKWNSLSISCIIHVILSYFFPVCIPSVCLIIININNNNNNMYFSTQRKERN